MRTIIITGASDGIGAAASRQLASGRHPASHQHGRPAANGMPAEGDTRLILVGRSPEKTRAIAALTGAEYHLADFTRLDEVRDLAAALNDTCDRIDVLANNAGGIFSGPTTTEDGFEKTFQVNHLGPYLLTHLLIDKLLDSRAAVVNTSSVGARLFGRIDRDDLNTWRNFSPNRAYGNAKLANILFAKGLHDRFHDCSPDRSTDRGLSSVAFHPGMVATSFASDTSSYFRGVYHGVLARLLISSEQGGARLRHFIDGAPGHVESSDHAWASGEYYGAPGRISRTNRQAYDPGIVREHWERSADMLGVHW